MEKNMEVPLKTKNRATIWSSNPTPVHTSGEKHGWKDTWTAVFIAALLTIARTWKKPKLSINRGMDKEHVVHTYNGLLSHKKNGIMSFAAIVEQRDCHTEWKKVRKRKTNIYHLYVESKKKYKWTYIQNRYRLTDVENLMVTRRQEWGEVNCQTGIDIHTLLYII